MSGAIATAAIVGGIGAAGSIGGAAIASNAAGNAAGQQSAAANHAADLNYQASQNALDFQKQQYNTSQQQLQPWLQSGTGALSNLNYLMGLSPMSAQQFMGAPGPSSGALPVGGTASGIAPRPTGGPATYTGPNQPMSMVNPQGMSGYSPFPSNQPNSGALPRTGVTAGTLGNMQLGTGGAKTYNGPTSPVALATGASPGNVASLGGTSLQPSSGAVPSSGGFGSLMQPYGQTFQAPTGLTEQNDPGYQARLNLGTDAIQRSAAARGGVLTGGTAKALETYGQDYGSNEYANAYNRALTGFTTNYNQYNNDQANQFNRLAALSGVGQTTAGQLGSLGNQAAQGISSNLLGTAANMGQDYQNAAAANASGIVGGANAWSGALGNTGNSIQNLLLLKQLGGFGSSGTSYSSGDNGGF